MRYMIHTLKLQPGKRYKDKLQMKIGHKINLLSHSGQRRVHAMIISIRSESEKYRKPEEKKNRVKIVLTVRGGFYSDVHTYNMQRKLAVKFKLLNPVLND